MNKTKEIILNLFVTVEVPETQENDLIVMKIDLSNSYPIDLINGERIGKIVCFETDGVIE